MNGQSSNIVNGKKESRFDNNIKGLIAAFLGALSIIFMFFIVFIGMIIGLISIILGTVALVELRTSEQYGKGMAILGTVCGSISLGLPLLIIIYATFVL